MVAVPVAQPIVLRAQPGVLGLPCGDLLGQPALEQLDLVRVDPAAAQWRLPEGDVADPVGGEDPPEPGMAVVIGLQCHPE
nr:hypothetical protein [Qaidamihabitans albus]